ncbi:oxygenase MpaB family protein [Gordonia rhizosphera]|uniref:ER-bound oxygenase mpaB/mpaB'/Rubber oxygenase catalytic domain-containing protein n=1 Tax=Gordonia rhizosphera NBRC 16068 TaxID=1108045 RepID=K6WWM8_9ACTN|nr:oxygenase MpaB family protein [Gordonia rhizosphera]GAB90969.1 hypothetical protein GORHZ_120_00250 [Gordonia rhizosphera NBRC 16068]
MTVTQSTPGTADPVSDAAETGSDAAQTAADVAVISHADDEIELIPADSLTAELTGRYTFLPVNGAAFVMQVMHPVIGDIVGEYSVFRTDPLGRAIRSVDSVLRWVYGGTEAIEEGKRLRRMHQPLQMRNAEGRHISALNPEAYQWVIATAFPTACRAAPLILGREFTEQEKQEVFRDNRRVAKIVQVPMKGYPETIEEFDRYFDDMIENKLVAHPTALALVAQMQSSPRFDRVVPKDLVRFTNAVAKLAAVPAQKVNYLTTVGVMDPRVREILGLSWSDKEQRELERIHTVIRGMYRVLPERLTYFPLAYYARRQHAVMAAMKKREAGGNAYKIARRKGAAAES